LIELRVKLEVAPEGVNAVLRMIRYPGVIKRGQSTPVQSNVAQNVLGDLAKSGGLRLVPVALTQPRSAHFYHTLTFRQFRELAPISNDLRPPRRWLTMTDSRQFAQLAD
jgi:hypothetical protein